MVLAGSVVLIVELMMLTKFKRQKILFCFIIRVSLCEVLLLMVVVWCPC